MKILFFCDEYPPGRHGGIGTCVQLFGRELVRQGHQVWVAGLYDYGYGGADEEDDEGVKVFRLRKEHDKGYISNRYTFRDKLLLRLLQATGLRQRDTERGIGKLYEFANELIRREDIDIVELPDFFHFTQYLNRPVRFPSLQAPYTIKLHGSVSYFRKEAGQPVPPAILETEKALLQGARAVVSVSRYTADRTAGYLEYARPIEVIYNGVEVPEDLPAVRDPLKVVFSGSLLEKKGILQLMKAWNKVAKAMPGAALTILGKGDANPARSLLDSDVQATVAFKGHVDRASVFRHYAEAAVVALPSFAECFALAPMEAMACGTPVVYTTRTSGPELIADGENGLLADPADVDELAEKILLLLRDTPLREKLGKKGADTLRTHFAIQVVSAQQARFYEKLLNKGSN